MKRIFLLLSLYITQSFMSQSIDTGFSKPEATISSLSTYNNAAISYATGIPDISFPVVSLPTNSKDVFVGMAISYHPQNLLSSEKAADIGLGWSLLGNGVISRQLIGDIDEKYDDLSDSHYFKNPFDDYYYYSMGGYSGKFKIVRDIENNTFQIVKLTPSNLKIEYIRENNNATLIFKSFKITDDKGYVYVFDKFSVAEFKDVGTTWGKAYRSAFYLTKVYNYKMQELVSYNYQQDTYTSPTMMSGIPVQTQKLNKIVAVDNGSIDIVYNFISTYRRSLNDPFEISHIELKDKSGNLNSKIEFSYAYLPFTNPGNFYDTITKRLLTKIKKYSKDLTKSETTEFTYNENGSFKEYSPVPGQFKEYSLCSMYQHALMNEIENPKYFPVGSLKRIKLPTGGAVEYNFEANEYAADNISQYVGDLGYQNFVDPQFQYLKPIYAQNFDTRQSKVHNYTVSGSPASPKAIYIVFNVFEKFAPDPMLDPGTPLEVDYTIPGTGYGANITDICSEPAANMSVRKFIITGGANTITITGTGGRGYFEIFEMAIKDGPYKNAIPTEGLRIESIKYYDNFYSQIPVKSQKFVYDMFDNGNSSSGILFSEGTYMGQGPETIVYKNVKILNGDNGGYTKYYYKSPAAYPQYSIGEAYNFWPNINITKSGLLEKKEIYDNTHHRLADESYEYTIEETADPKYVLVPGSSGPTYYTKTAWIKEQRSVSKAYDSNGRSVTTSSESLRESGSYNLVKEKTTASDGMIQEVTYRYAADKNHTALINAHIVGIPLETEVKKNGTAVSKSEVRFDNPSNLYPTSVLAYTPDNLANSYPLVKYDVYDSKGHVVQYSTMPDSPTGTGTPATIIWGYNNTVPIAKIDGAKLSDIPQSLIDSIVNASNEDANATPSTAQAKEDALLVQLENFKNHSALAGFTVTAYTYNPLVGVTNVLPANGIREIYSYDSFNRLEKVKDVNGKTLKEYQYNYKQ